MHSRGFTVIELLIAIAFLGILSATIVMLLNATSSLNRANVANGKIFASQVKTSLVVSQVGEWNFEEGSGSIAYDTSGYGNDGTLLGGTAWQTASQCGLGFGGCVDFPGNIGDYIRTSQNISINLTRGFTVAFWMKADSFKPIGLCYYTGLVAHWGAPPWSPPPGQATAFYISLNSITACSGTANWLKFFVASDNAGINPVLVIFGPLSTNTWYQVVGTYDGSTAKLYVNGSLKGTHTPGSPPGGTYSYAINIGNLGKYNNLAEYFDGQIDEVSIYKKPLISSQIQQLYAQGLLRHLAKVLPASLYGD